MNIQKNKSILPKKRRAKKYDYKIEIFIITTIIITIIAINFLQFKTKPIQPIKKTIEYKEKQRPTYEYLKSVTVRIIGKSIEEMNKDYRISTETNWIATGIVIKIDKEKQITYILTNAHSVGLGLPNVEIVIEQENRLINAQIIKYHKSLDLAIIKVNILLGDKIEIRGYANAKIQEEVFLVGHHLKKKYLYGEGVFAGYSGAEGIIQIPVLYGNSGSGVFNKEGKLIGIVFAGEIYTENGCTDVAHGIIIETYNIKIFLRELELLDE